MTTDHAHPELEARIAALEAQMRDHSHIHTDDGWRLGTSGAPVCSKPAAPCPICTAPMNDFDGGCVRNGPEDIAEWVKEHAQPAAPDAGDAGPEAKTDSEKLRGAMACIASQDRIMDAKDAEIAVLRAKLTEQSEATTIDKEEIVSLRLDRDRLAAQVENLEACAETWKGEIHRQFEENKSLREGLANLEASVTALHNDAVEANNLRITAEKSAVDASLANAERDKAVSDLAAMRDRAERAERFEAVCHCGELVSRHTAGDGHSPVEMPWECPTERERDAARADLAAVVSEIQAGEQVVSTTAEAVQMVREIKADLASANEACAEKQAAIEKFLCGEQAADAEIARLKADLAAATERAEKAEANRHHHNECLFCSTRFSAVYDRCPVCAARAEANALRREVETLRRYGNKDCTAMADAALPETQS